MKILSFLTLTTLAVPPAFAQEPRGLGSHEHGVGQLDIALDGSLLAMELRAPGADIVGFEYAAESAEDLGKIEDALMVLAQPLELFAVPAAAKCSIVQASAELDGGTDHEDHGDEDHSGHDHGSDGHTEFHAAYLLECGDITELNEISFDYFAAFPNALELEVQLLSDMGARAFEVERGSPVLDLGDLD